MLQQKSFLGFSLPLLFFLLCVWYAGDDLGLMVFSGWEGGGGGIKVGKMPLFPFHSLSLLLGGRKQPAPPPKKKGRKKKKEVH